MFTLISCTSMAGVAEWVCCPGEKNSILCEALAACPVIHRWAVPDDRSAAFFALGRVQATARPVVVAAGDGSAAASMSAAVAAAYYERRPLVVLTVDSSCDVGGTGAPLAMEKQNLFGNFAPTVELSLPCPVSDLPDLSALLAEGFPLHLHVRIDESSKPGGTDFSALEVGSAPEAPAFRGSLVALSQMLRFRAAEGLVMIIGALEPTEQEPVLWLAQTLRVPVVAEASSGLREELAAQLLHGADELLMQYPPRYVLRVGGVPTSRFWEALEDLPETEVFSITRTGFSGLCRRSSVIEGEPEQIMKALGDVPHVGDTERLLARSRHTAGRNEERLLAHPESAAALVRAFSIHASLGDVVCLSSPTVSELWNRYAQCRVPTLYLRDLSTNGADGAVSAFLGNAADASSAFCLVGDLTLLRDLQAATIVSQLPPGRRIVAVLNNDGAGGAAYVAGNDPELQRLLVQAPVFDPENIARLWGAEYYRVQSEADLEVLDSLEEDAFVLLELIPDGNL